MTRTAFILIIALLAATAWSEEEVIGEPLEEAGTRIELPSGDMLQLTIDERLLVGYFVDKDGKLIESPANSIVFEIDQPSHRNDRWRTVIKLVDEAKLTSVRRLSGPYKLKAKLIIRFKDGSTKAFANAHVELDKKPE